jgi:hypothetical protein
MIEVKRRLGFAAGCQPHGPAGEAGLAVHVFLRDVHEWSFPQDSMLFA